MTIYSAGTNNMIIDELVFQIDRSAGDVIITMPSTSDYVGSGSGVFNKTTTYSWTDISSSEDNAFIFISNPTDKTRQNNTGKGDGTFTVIVSGIYERPSSNCLITMLETS